jgi:signal transduction histidine kinase
MNRIKITFALDENIPSLIGDQERLKQVWLNLLNNAADVIEQDGEIHVRSKLFAEERKLVVSIADTGKGIAAVHLRKIFDPFFTTKQVGKGTGLGLSVSFGIIKDHGGKIFALSPPPAEYFPKDFLRRDHFGPGAVFIVELPLDNGRKNQNAEDSRDVMHLQ